MCLLRILPLCFLAVACAVPARLVTTATDTVTTVPAAAEDLAKADVVAIGEMHKTPSAHAVHHELLRELQARRGNVVIAMEMFERDVQTVLLSYLTGMIDEGTFLAQSRPWPDYKRDYRPVIEFAKANGLVVLAANAPRELATQVAKEGLAGVMGNAFVARETTAPEDEYWDAFVEMMKEHGGTAGDGSMRRYYEAQCLKDDTMAESVVDYLKARRQAGERPLVVLICGRMHSDYGRGTVARIKRRMPDLDVRVLSTETVDDLSSGIYASPRAMAEYVVVAQKGPEREAEVAVGPSKSKGTNPHEAKPVNPHEAKPVNPHEAKPANPHEAKPANPHQAKPVEPGHAATEATDARPALGLMPEYAYQNGDGVKVASVRADGPADKAGIEPDDLITALGGSKITDVQSYAEVLDAQKIGKTVTVCVRRGGAEVDLQVLVGERSR
ncbi:MAG: ChaN family lipoprotein [Planctomycetota bacterium]